MSSRKTDIATNPHNGEDYQFINMIGKKVFTAASTNGGSA